MWLSTLWPSMRSPCFVRVHVRLAWRLFKIFANFLLLLLLLLCCFAGCCRLKRRRPRGDLNSNILVACWRKKKYASQLQVTERRLVHFGSLLAYNERAMMMSAGWLHATSRAVHPARHSSWWAAPQSRKITCSLLNLPDAPIAVLMRRVSFSCPIT